MGYSEGEWNIILGNKSYSLSISFIFIRHGHGITHYSTFPFIIFDLSFFAPLFISHSYSGRARAPYTHCQLRVLGKTRRTTVSACSKSSCGSFIDCCQARFRPWWIFFLFPPLSLFLSLSLSLSLSPFSLSLSLSLSLSPSLPPSLALFLSPPLSSLAASCTRCSLSEVSRSIS